MLRDSGIFSEVRESHHVPYYQDFDPAVHGHADWILAYDDSRGYIAVGPMLPFDTLFTFGLIPTTQSGDVSNAYRLTRTDGTTPAREIIVPVQGTRVTGLISALFLSLLPDWHLFREEQKRDERVAARLAAEVLRTVMDAPSR